MKRLILFFIVFQVYSCGSKQISQENKQADKPVVTTVNYPLYYFAQRIGGDLIKLEYPIPDDVDPAYWIPDNEALTIYQSADIILANGANYAMWMNNVSLPASRVINTSKSLKEKYIPLKKASTHSHGPEGEHEHSGYAFTTWLDFEFATVQAEAVKNSLVSKLPGNKQELDNNYKSLKNELLVLHEQLKEVSIQIGKQNIIGSHPVYQYLARAYNINIHSVHFEPDEIPSEDQWQEFDELLKLNPSSLMLWEAEPMPVVQERLAKKGIQVVVFNPCANRPNHNDFMDIMNENIKAVQIGFSK
jgi:zinc transport system substrate-binding protein